jgi:hypothetical protein
MELDIPAPFVLGCFKSHCSVLIFFVCGLTRISKARSCSLFLIDDDFKSAATSILASALWLSKKGHWPVRVPEILRQEVSMFSDELYMYTKQCPSHSKVLFRMRSSLGARIIRHVACQW